MSFSLGSAAIALTANSSGLHSGLSSVTGTIRNFARTAIGILGPVAAAFSFKAALSAAAEQEAAEKKLEAVLRATGGAAGFSAEQLKQYAAALQGVTTFGDETIINAQALLATFKNVSGSAFQEATKAALDMATVMDQDLNSSILLVGKALNDPIRGLSALSRTGVQFTDGQRAMIESMVEAGNAMGAQKIILAELQSQFGGAAEAAAGTLGGAMTQLKNAVGDTLEIFGKFAGGDGGLFRGLTASVTQFNASLTDNGTRMGQFVEGVQVVLSAFVDSARAAWGFVSEAFVTGVTAIGEALFPLSGQFTSFKAVIEGVRDGFVVAFAAIEWAFTNWADLTALRLLQVGKFFVDLKDRAVWVLVDVIPSTLTWFAGNWKDIFTDMYNLTVTIFANLATNIWNVVSNLGGLITGSVNFGDLWTPLTDGFKSALQELPAIAEFESSKLAKTLGDTVAMMKDELGADFAEFVGQRLQSVMFKTPAGDTGSSGPSAPAFTRPTATMAKPVPVVEVSGGGGGGFGSGFTGLDQEHKRIQSAANSEQRRLVKAAEETAKYSREAALTMKQIKEERAQGWKNTPRHVPR